MKQAFSLKSQFRRFLDERKMGQERKTENLLSPHLTRVQNYENLLFSAENSTETVAMLGPRA